MTRYSIKPETRKYVKWYGFSLFAREYKKKIFDKGLDASKKVVHKVGAFIDNKVAGAVTNSNGDNIEKQYSVEEIIILPK